MLGRKSRSDVSYNIVFNKMGTGDPFSLNEHFVNVKGEKVKKVPQISFPSSKYTEEQSVMLYETNVVEMLSQIASFENSPSHGVDLTT